MSEVSKVNSQTSVREMYDSFKKNTITEVFANYFLLNSCEVITKNYEQIIEDQNDYVVEIEDSIEELENIEEDIQAKIKKLEAEIAELNQKKEAGTITSEEETQLESKTNELNSLQVESEEDVNEQQKEVDDKIENIENTEHKSKAEIATEFGDFAIEKGTELTQVKDKRKSFWRKLFNTWDKSGTRAFGQKLINAGEGLLEKVSYTDSTEERIKEVKNKSTTK